MNKKQSNKLNSFRTTEEVLTQNKTVWSKSLKAVAIFALISGKLKLVSDTDKRKNLKQPSSILKAGQKVKVIAQAVKISTSGVDYAAGKNDEVLEFQVKVTKSQLMKMKTNTLLTTLLKLYENLFPYRAELIHLDKKDFETFKIMLDEFVAAMPKPQAELGQSKTANQTLESLMEELNELFITLDKHIGPFQYTAPTFYSDYKNSRIIKDLKKVSKATVAARKEKKSSKAA